MKTIIFKDKKIKNLIAKICEEHHGACKTEDSNMGYLWYMYAYGNKKDTYKPFIFMCELNLLVKTGYVTEEEANNMLNMLQSADEDNANITAYAINTFREDRLKNLGHWTTDNEKYKHINYTSDIINYTVFSGPNKK